MRARGFTLIELLIVVAIIAILAAIAVPNFLEAQTRSKVSRVKADQRSLAVAIESYKIDYNYYPSNEPSIEWPGYQPSGPGREWKQKLGMLTSPTAYVTSLPIDPFGGLYAILDAENSSEIGGAGTREEWGKWYHYNDLWPGGQYWGMGQSHGRYYPNSYPEMRRPPPGPTDGMDGMDCWFMVSIGPSRKHHPYEACWCDEYDPTNGTASYGGICRWGP